MWQGKPGYKNGGTIVKENLPEETKEDSLDRDPVFYYSREHRLNRASQTVRTLNEGEGARPGLAKTLFGTRGNIFLFGSILMICAMLVITSRFPGGERTIKLGGNALTLTVSREEGGLILEMIKNAPKKGEAYTGDVWFAVSPVLSKSKEGGQPQVFTEYVTFFPIGYEVYRFSLPFTNSVNGDDSTANKSDAFFIVLRAGDEQKTMRLNAIKSR